MSTLLLDTQEAYENLLESLATNILLGNIELTEDLTYRSYPQLHRSETVEELFEEIRGSLQLVKRITDIVGNPDESIKTYPNALLVIQVVDKFQYISQNQLKKRAHITSKKLEWMALRGLVRRVVIRGRITFASTATGERALKRAEREPNGK